MDCLYTYFLMWILTNSHPQISLVSIHIIASLFSNRAYYLYQEVYVFWTANCFAADMWYLWSGKKTDAVNGFWKSTGEACEIYSTSTITSLRKTFNFYEGRSPDGKKNNWMMQKYVATDKFTSKLACTLSFRPIYLWMGQFGLQ